MSTLILVRHAHASNGSAARSDRERPLTERGKQDAATMGASLAARRLVPDLMISSPALRALSTARLFADQLGYGRADILVDERLYAGSVGVLLAIVHGLDPDRQQVMLFGHNPEFTELAHQLSNAIVDMPTCAVAEFGFASQPWTAVGVVAPLTVTRHSPKE